MSAKEYSSSHKKKITTYWQCETSVHVVWLFIKKKKKIKKKKNCLTKVLKV